MQEIQIMEGIVQKLKHYINILFLLQALRNQGLQLKKDGVPIYGLGIQGHFFSHNLDMDVLKVNKSYLNHALSALLIEH
jgi:hypothetical protein